MHLLPNSARSCDGVLRHIVLRDAHPTTPEVPVLWDAAFHVAHVVQVKVLEPEEEVDQVVRKHSQQQMVVTSDSDSSAAVLQLAVGPRRRAPVPGAPLRQEVYPPSCILPDISQVISPRTAAVQTCSSKASCGSAAVAQGAGAATSAWPVAGAGSSRTVAVSGAVSSSDVGAPSCSVPKASDFLPCCSAFVPGRCEQEAAVRNGGTGDSRETNVTTMVQFATAGTNASGGGMSSQQSQSEGVPGIQSECAETAQPEPRGIVRHRGQGPAEEVCRSSKFACSAAHW